MRRALVVLTALLAFPASAHAGWFPGEQIDGPSGDIVSVGDVDLGNDGTGVVAYVKRDGGVNHVFASRLDTGTFTGSDRLDNGLALPTSQPVVAAGSEGRMVVAWVNDGSLWTAVRARGANGWSAPNLVASGGVSNPDADMSTNGITYVSFTQNGDVRVARAERDSATFTVLGQPLDVNPGRDAGSGERKHSRVAVSADGSALAVWGEDGPDGRTHVYGRRLFELRVSVAPQDLTLDNLDGAVARSADTPHLDIEWDSSYAQVVFRQDTVNGPRVVMRRLVGSAFEPHEAVDAGAFATEGSIDLTGRGEGIIAARGAGGEVFGSTLWNNAINFRARMDGGGTVAPGPVAAVGENEDGTISWLQADGQARGRFIDNVERPQLEGEAGLNNGGFGPVDVNSGFDAAATRTGDTAVVFIQGAEADRRLVAAYYDKPPSRPTGTNSTKPRRLTKLRWSGGLNLLGPTAYRVLVDGRVIGETQTTELVVDPETVPEGVRTWQIQAIDRRAQTAMSRTRQLRIDNTAPSIRAGFKRKGRVLTITAKGGDPNGALKTGLSHIVVSYGNGATARMTRKRTYRYPRTGSYTVTVTAVDRAGNTKAVTKRIRIG